MKRIVLLLSVLLLGLGQTFAATTKVHADFANATGSSGATWDAETQVLTWTMTYANQVRNLGLPTGDLSAYEKLVVECDDLNASSFRLLVYNGTDATTMVVDHTGVSEFYLRDYLTAAKLATVTEVCLSGGNGEANGSVHIIDLYLETFDDAVVQKKDPELSFSVGMVLMEPGDAFTAPTLNNPHGLPVTYSAVSQPEGAISVDATSGNVTLAEGELSGTVTATFAGNDEYNAGQASYAITVRKATVVGDVPLVYNVENTAAALPDPVFPTMDQLPYIEPLTDPLEFSDGSGRALDFKDWARRRGEIAREIQHYEIGDKPAVSMDDIDASMDGNTLTVKVTVDGQVLTLTSTISYPAGGSAPYPLMIGADNNSLPGNLLSSRNIATMNFSASQVNGYSQMGGSSARDFERLYPHLSENGAYSEWAWGFSRLIDGLQKLGPEVTKIDMEHIGVTGCSYAGKMALFCGAFDERVALTIAQESGGGGCAAWRVTWVHNRDYTKEDAWEGHTNTDGNWFSKSFKKDASFDKNKIFYLPYDHHELVALCCPRGFLMLGNPDYVWLADGSGYVSMEAARKVWEQYGVADRCGYSIINGHSHCQLPQSQYAEVEAYLDRFLLGKDVDTDNVRKAPFYQEGGSRATPLEDLGQWMDWWGTGEPPLLPDNRPAPFRVFGTPTDIMTASTTDWVLEDDETAPTGKAVRATVKNTECPDDQGQALKFTFSVPQKQKYYIYAYVNCAKAANDAVFIGFDDGTAYNSNGANTKGEWAWKNLYSLLSNADKTSFSNTLDVGEHSLYIYDKELDYKLGAVCVSNTEKLDDFKDEVANLNIGDYLTNIKAADSEQVVASQYFTIDGRRLSRLQKGLNVVRQTLKDGTVRSRTLNVER